MWDDPKARDAHRANLIRAWFRDLDRTDGPGMVLMTWERMMPVQEWWATVLEMVRLAPHDRCFGVIGAGPLEGLLGAHGEEVMDRVEIEASTDPRFRKALNGVWKERMSDEVWGRVQALQLKVPEQSQGDSDER